jgi:hypothetical protein
MHQLHEEVHCEARFLVRLGVPCAENYAQFFKIPCSIYAITAALDFFLFCANSALILGQRFFIAQ